jgi:hypothetical protein
MPCGRLWKQLFKCKTLIIAVELRRHKGRVGAAPKNIFWRCFVSIENHFDDLLIVEQCPGTKLLIVCLTSESRSQSLSFCEFGKAFQGDCWTRQYSQASTLSLQNVAAGHSYSCHWECRPLGFQFSTCLRVLSTHFSFRTHHSCPSCDAPSTVCFM